MTVRESDEAGTTWMLSWAMAAMEGSRSIEINLPSGWTGRELKR